LDIHRRPYRRTKPVPPRPECWTCTRSKSDRGSNLTQPSPGSRCCSGFRRMRLTPLSKTNTYEPFNEQSGNGGLTPCAR
jgi:hypothetical protein